MKYAALGMLLAGCALGGCAPAITWPAGFVEVDRDHRGPFTARAVSADGAVMGLRTEENPRNATLDFWAVAVRDELVNKRGYALVKEEAVTSADGTAGRLMTFATQTSGVDFTYLAAVYVKGSQVLVAEAGGKTEAVKPKLDDIRKGLTGLRAAGI